MTGTSTCRTMSGTARAASSVLTVTRTSSEPAWWRARTWAAVASASAVSVLVMDWTTIGWAEPTVRAPRRTVTVRQRPIAGLGGDPNLGYHPRKPFPGCRPDAKLTEAQGARHGLSRNRLEAPEQDPHLFVAEDRIPNDGQGCERQRQSLETCNRRRARPHRVCTRVGPGRVRGEQQLEPEGASARLVLNRRADKEGDRVRRAAAQAGDEANFDGYAVDRRAARGEDVIGEGVVLGALHEAQDVHVEDRPPLAAGDGDSPHRGEGADEPECVPLARHGAS